MSLLVLGNGKLGPIYHFDLPAGKDYSCPGESTYCRALCYAKHGTFRFPSVQRKYQSNWELAQELDVLVASLILELRQLSLGSVVRIHTSGDFFNADYIEVWATLAEGFPEVRFYAYTRSWRVPELLPALESLGRLPNVQIWGSTDPTTGPVPAGWREATMVKDWSQASGMIHCPEQTGRKRDCRSCGICFAAKLRTDVCLAFKEH